MAAPDTTPGTRLGGARLALALALLFGGGTIWGLSFSAAKLITEAGAHPFGLSLANGFFGAAILLPYCIVRRRLPPLRRDYLVFYVVAGLLGTALPSALLYSAAPHLPAGVLAIVTALVPLMTYVYALGLRLERAEALRACGIVLGLLAILMIVVPEASLPHRAMVGWVLLALIVPASYSSEGLFIALRRPAGSDAIVLLCGMQLAGAAMLAPLVWATDGWLSLALPWGEIEWWIVALVVVNTVGYLMYIELVRIAGPVFAAQTGYLVTASGVLWGIAIFGERHSAWVWAALAVMFAGLFLVNPRANHAAPVRDNRDGDNEG